MQTCNARPSTDSDGAVPVHHIHVFSVTDENPSVRRASRCRRLVDLPIGEVNGRKKSMPVSSKVEAVVVMDDSLQCSDNGREPWSFGFVCPCLLMVRVAVAPRLNILSSKARTSHSICDVSSTSCPSASNIIITGIYVLLVEHYPNLHFTLGYPSYCLSLRNLPDGKD